MATANLQIAFQTEKGSPHPLGATLNREGVNFSPFSSNATAVELLLFKRHDDAKPFQTVQLDPNVNKTLIGEAWDAAGLYQIGNFPGDRWSEWNGRFRDDIRRFVKGDPGLVGAVAYRLSGVEGESTDPAVEALRTRQLRNFATLLLLSRGVPMFVAGDEVRRTQRGKNNAYCQDNDVSWFDWNLVDKNRDMYRFWKRVIEFRKHHSILRQRCFFNGAVNERGLADVSWHSCKLNSPGWSDPSGRALGMTLGGSNGEVDIYVMMNMYWEKLDFEIPVQPRRLWFKVLDTAEPSPHDIVDPGNEVEVDGRVCPVEGRSIVVLVSK